MNFDEFARARDFLYLAALLFGAGTGCILNRFRRKGAGRFRNSAVTAGLCFFSGTVAALTAASIFSNWMIFKESALYLPAGILAGILTLGFRFPRAAGFPLLLVSGVLVVWNGYMALNFPLVEGSGGDAAFMSAGVSAPPDRYSAFRPDLPDKNPAAGAGMIRLRRDEAGLIGMRLTFRPGAKSGIALSFQSTKDDDLLEFRAFCISYAKAFPLTGGSVRGVITRIRADDEILYADSRFERNFFSRLPERSSVRRAPFFSFREIPGKVEAGELVPGVEFSLAPGETALELR